MTAPAYPRRWEADLVVADGGTVHLRPIRPDDAERLADFHSRLSQETVYNRFFAYRPVLSDADVARFTQVDHDDRVALVATLNDDIIGVVRYDRLPGTHDAEVAFVVEDAHQGRGLGPLLLEHLGASARERGIGRFTADVLPTNRKMLGVFRTAGYAVARELSGGYVELSFPITLTGTSLEVMRAREHRAEARSVQRLLSPRSVAVVGASREPGSPGHELLRSLLANGFEGPVFPVNPAASHVSGVKAYADVRDVPDLVDLAVIAVPAPEVADAVRACAAKGVRGLVVVSGGFADAGPEGRARLDEVVQLARAGGMRLIGPNAMGVVNTDPAVRLHATFAAGSPPAGTVGVFSQSGALAGTFLAETERRGLGLSSFVSIGDRADVSGNDLLQYWRADERTEVVLLHLQGFGNPRKFARIAREVGRTKPVVALKSGHGQGDVAVDALFASAGVVRVGSLAQLFSTAQLFAYQPLPAGPRVGIVGNSSALAAMAADACRSAGLQVPELTEGLRIRLRALTGTTETANPVDLGPFAGPSELAGALDVLMGSGQVDAVLAVVVPPPNARDSSVGDQLAAVLTSVGTGRLPLLASFLGTDGVPPVLAVAGPSGGPGRGSVPSYASPESAVLALSRAVAYARWRAEPEGTVPDLPHVDGAAATAALADLPLDGSWLSQADAARVLGHVGIHVWPTALVDSAEQAVEAADRLGWPV
ncbi:MAG: GNAT family N-acetyltransferase, partial [Frankiales bacterium]|nr:GNAT family N-acetyltransferase [Frankiales bacterium]